MADSGRGSRLARGGEPSEAPDPNRRLLLWRVLVTVGLIAAALGVRTFGSGRVVSPGVVAAIGLLATSLAASWAALVAGTRRDVLLAAQLAADVVCIGLVVQFTGGPFSVFPLVFCLPILLAARYAGRRGALIVAAGAAIFTGGGHFGFAVGWLMAGRESHLAYLQSWPMFVTCLHIGVFVVVGLISADLAQRSALRRLPDRGDAGAAAARSEVRTILDNIRSGLLLVDGRGTVTRVNPTCCRILELAEDDIVGRDLRAVTAGGMEPLADAIMQVARGGDPIHRGELTLRRRGREVPVGLNVNHMTYGDGLRNGAIAIFTDLTREKELSARIRDADRLAAVGELAASIAHEIRNPLASIRGSVEILAGELEVVGYQSQLLDLVLKESSRVNTIINDFLAYSRMRPAQKRRFPANEFRDEITLQIRQHIAAKNGQIGVTCDVYPENLMVYADTGQLTQMALNLAINACEAMSYNGQLKIALNLRDGGEACELVVADTGPGVLPEIRDQLFSPFKTTKDGGTGLGLSIVARIAAAHGGSVRAGDAPGGGAVFRVRWPQDEAAGSVAATRDVAAPEPASSPVGAA